MVEEVRGPVRPDDEHSGDAELTSPMPGSVVAWVCRRPERAAGAVVVTVEAMKMEHALAAPVDGRSRITRRPRRSGQGGPAAGQDHRQPSRRFSRCKYEGRRNMSDFLATGMLPDHYEQLAKTVRDFAQSVVAPVSAKHDEEHSFPYEVVSGMADMGLFGLPFPEEYGGMGGDYFALCLALEELGKVDQSVAITLEAGVSLGAMPVYRFGNEEQKQEWLPLLASGKGARCVRADRGGRRHRRGRHQDHGQARRRALGHQRLQAVHHQLGHRHHQARHRHCHHWRSRWQEEISSILVPVPTEGFTAEPAYNKVGWNASDTHPLSFDDVRVPAENLLGERGRGLRELPAHPR
jgi:hypothetical protein